MIVGAPILPCCCDEGDCAGIPHASAPSTLSVSGGYTMIQRNREGWCPAFSGPNVNNWSTATTVVVSFQGVIPKQSAAAWVTCPQGDCLLYSGKVEWSWSVSQSISCNPDIDPAYDPYCNGHSESASHTYNSCPLGSTGFFDANACLPRVQIHCTDGGVDNVANPPTVLCGGASLPTLGPKFLQATFDQGAIQSSSASGANFIGLNYPYRPTRPWPGICTRYNAAQGSSPFLFRQFTSPFSGGCSTTGSSLNWAMPSVFTAARSDNLLTGQWTPVRNRLSPVTFITRGGFTSCTQPPSGCLPPGEPPRPHTCEEYDDLEANCIPANQRITWTVPTIVDSYLETS